MATKLLRSGSTADASVYSFTYNCGSSQMCPGCGGYMLTDGWDMIDFLGRTEGLKSNVMLHSAVVFSEYF